MPTLFDTVYGCAYDRSRKLETEITSRAIVIYQHCPGLREFVYQRCLPRLKISYAAIVGKQALARFDYPCLRGGVISAIGIRVNLFFLSGYSQTEPTISKILRDSRWSGVEQSRTCEYTTTACRRPTRKQRRLKTLMMITFHGRRGGRNRGWRIEKERRKGFHLV